MEPTNSMTRERPKSMIDIRQMSVQTDFLEAPHCQPQHTDNADQTKVDPPMRARLQRSATEGGHLSSRSLSVQSFLTLSKLEEFDWINPTKLGGTTTSSVDSVARDRGNFDVVHSRGPDVTERSRKRSLYRSSTTSLRSFASEEEDGEVEGGGSTHSLVAQTTNTDAKKLRFRIQSKTNLRDFSSSSKTVNEDVEDDDVEVRLLKTKKIFNLPSDGVSVSEGESANLEKSKLGEQNKSREIDEIKESVDMDVLDTVFRGDDTTTVSRDKTGEYDDSRPVLSIARTSRKYKDIEVRTIGNRQEIKQSHVKAKVTYEIFEQIIPPPKSSSETSTNVVEPSPPQSRVSEAAAQTSSELVHAEAQTAKDQSYSTATQATIDDERNTADIATSASTDSLAFCQLSSENAPPLYTSSKSPSPPKSTSLSTSTAALPATSTSPCLSVSPSMSTVPFTSTSMCPSTSASLYTSTSPSMSTSRSSLMVQDVLDYIRTAVEMPTNGEGEIKRNRYSKPNCDSMETTEVDDKVSSKTTKKLFADLKTTLTSVQDGSHFDKDTKSTESEGAIKSTDEKTQPPQDEVTTNICSDKSKLESMDNILLTSNVVKSCDQFATSGECSKPYELPETKPTTPSCIAANCNEKDLTTTKAHDYIDHAMADEHGLTNPSNIQIKGKTKSDLLEYTKPTDESIREAAGNIPIPGSLDKTSLHQNEKQWIADQSGTRESTRESTSCDILYGAVGNETDIDMTDTICRTQQNGESITSENQFGANDIPADRIGGFDNTATHNLHKSQSNTAMRGPEAKRSSSLTTENSVSSDMNDDVSPDRICVCSNDETSSVAVHQLKQDLDNICKISHSRALIDSQREVLSNSSPAASTAPIVSRTNGCRRKKPEMLTASDGSMPENERNGGNWLYDGDNCESRESDQKSSWSSACKIDPTPAEDTSTSSDDAEIGNEQLARNIDNRVQKETVLDDGASSDGASTWNDQSSFKNQDIGSNRKANNTRSITQNITGTKRLDDISLTEQNGSFSPQDCEIISRTTNFRCDGILVSQNDSESAVDLLKLNNDASFLFDTVNQQMSGSTSTTEDIQSNSKVENGSGSTIMKSTPGERTPSDAHETFPSIRNELVQILSNNIAHETPNSTDLRFGTRGDLELGLNLGNGANELLKKGEGVDDLAPPGETVAGAIESGPVNYTELSLEKYGENGNCDQNEREDKNKNGKSVRFLDTRHEPVQDPSESSAPLPENKTMENLRTTLSAVTRSGPRDRDVCLLQKEATPQKDASIADDKQESFANSKSDIPRDMTAVHITPLDKPEALKINVDDDGVIDPTFTSPPASSNNDNFRWRDVIGSPGRGGSSAEYHGASDSSSVTSEASVKTNSSTQTDDILTARLGIGPVDRSAELEALQAERERIAGMLARCDVGRTSGGIVEETEARLNYGIGQTDALLRCLDDSFDDSATSLSSGDGWGSYYPGATISPGSRATTSSNSQQHPANPIIRSQNDYFKSLIKQGQPPGLFPALRSGLIPSLGTSRRESIQTNPYVHPSASVSRISRNTTNSLLLNRNISQRNTESLAPKTVKSQQYARRHDAHDYDASRDRHSLGHSSANNVGGLLLPASRSNPVIEAVERRRYMALLQDKKKLQSH